MSYVVESASSRRAKRRRRTAITLLLVVALLAGAFYVAASYWRRPAASAGSPGCPTSGTSAAATGTARAGSTARATARATATTKATVRATAKAPSPSQITVNVYNATSRNGLAGDVAKTVRARGFVVGTVSNDPLRRTVTQPAEVRYGRNGASGATVVGLLVRGVKRVQDARADSSVDLVLGNGFVALAPATPVATATTPGC